MVHHGKMTTNPETIDIDSMPRGGPDASWLDRRLQTDRLEYLDRDDVSDRVKKQVIGSLDLMGRILGLHGKFAELTLSEVADIADPKILELGSGHGGLSRKLLEQHPTAEVTVSDINPELVAAMAAGDLGSHPRATVRVIDATDIDAPDRHYDLAVFAQSFHHLPPPLAAQVIAEGTRAADKLLIIDLPRPRSPLHLIKLASVLPLVPVLPFAHDGFISFLRAYSRSAFQALAAHADPGIAVTFPKLRGSQAVVLARRPG